METIKLSACTEKILVAEIPSLISSAKSTKSALVNINKLDSNTNELMPLTINEAKKLRKILGIKVESDVLPRITKEDWVSLENKFNNYKRKPDWNLVPIWHDYPDVILERKVQQQLINDIIYKKGTPRLIVRDPITNSPSQDLNPDTFVTIKDFIKYARDVYLVEVLIEYDTYRANSLTMESINIVKDTVNSFKKNILRKNHLSSAIERAIKEAGNKELADVYLKLKEMALKNEQPFTGLIEGDALCYTDANDKPAKLTRKALSQRLLRSRKIP